MGFDGAQPVRNANIMFAMMKTVVVNGAAP